MTTTEQYLLVILAAALAVLLLLSIAVIIQVLRLIKRLQNIAVKAERLVDSAENVGEVLSHAIGHLSVMRFVKGIVDFVHNKDKKGRG